MPEKKSQESVKVIAQNRKARHDYIVQQTYEAGIALEGTEVKSCRNNGVSMVDCYAVIRSGELLVENLNIAAYAFGNRNNHEPRRTRKLLMHKQEIARLKRNIEEKGMTLIPLSMYFKRGRVKVELGLCRGKNVHDKREDLKKKSDQRDIQRAMNAKR
ncbi:MAG: SsrA-binding protein SmpB [Victivallales bacterium]|nr:SsrA-binding protein SmpB [Victivallales bacterium]